jgi:LacI family transcriptional regulator
MHKTLKDIARELNVSTATISRALNKDTAHLVRQETRQKIIDYVRRTGFKPNIKASALARGKLTNLFLILSQSDDSVFFDQYYMKIIRGIHDVILDTEYSLGLLSIDINFSPEQVDQVLFHNEIAGLILSPHCLAHKLYPSEILDKYDFPVISIDNEIEGENVLLISLDHKGAGCKGAEYLVKKGYKNLVLISDSEHSYHSELRKKGFYSYFEEEERGKDINITNLEFPFSKDSGKKALDRIKEMDIFPCGVFALNDEIAVEFINYMNETSLDCPGDLGILGFDGLTIDQYINPPLRSVSFPIREIGEKAASILIDILEGKRMRKHRLEYSAEISEGGSC